MKTPLLFLALFASSVASALSAPVTARSKLSAVTVYFDRAVVTRVAGLDVAAGPLELVFERLPASLADQSLQVSGHGSAQVTLLDVTTRETYVDFTPNERVRALEEELQALGRQRRVLDDRAKTLKAQEASLNRIENAATQPPTKEAPRLSLDEAAKLLVFLDEQRAKLAAEQQSLDVQVQGLAAKQASTEQQLAALRGSGGSSFKSVVVRLDAAAAGRLDLSLSYTVPGASWAPAYDARVLTSARSVQLSYFGVVRQNTGEDWKDVDLTLSTARPSLGGSPPSLFPWAVDVAYPQAAPAPALAGAMSALRRKAERGAGADGVVETEQFAAKDVKEDRPAEFARAAMQELATSASFKISTAASVPSDNTPQKVAVTSARLATAPEYVAIPKQLQAAFLNAKVTNTSEFPLLAGAMNIFLDDTFVAAGALGTVMPGEKFDLALGADEGIAIKRKLNNRFTEDTGLVNKGKRVTYDYTLIVQNNKKTEEKIVMVDQMPVSRNEKIVVKAVSPGEKELKPEADGTLRWTLVLKPGEKRELPLKFSIEYPNDLPVAGV